MNNNANTYAALTAEFDQQQDAQRARKQTNLASAQQNGQNARAITGAMKLGAILGAIVVAVTIVVVTR